MVLFLGGYLLLLLLGGWWGAIIGSALIGFANGLGISFIKMMLFFKKKVLYNNTQNT